MPVSGVVLVRVLVLGFGTLMAEDRTNLDTTLPIRGFAIGVPSPERVDDFLDQYFGRVPPVENEYGADIALENILRARNVN